MAAITAAQREMDGAAKTERSDTNITLGNGRKCVILSFQKWCTDGVPADRSVNHLLLKVTGRETKQIM